MHVMAVFSEIYDEDKDKVFVIRGTVEVRIPKNFYSQLKRKYSDEEIVSMQEPKVLQAPLHEAGTGLRYERVGLTADRPHGLRPHRPGH